MTSDSLAGRTRARCLRAAAGVAALAICPLWHGCQGLGGDNGGGVQAMVQGPTVTPVQHQMLENLPLPAGFYMVPERSVARSAGAVRVAQCEFQGGSNADAIARFYLQNMPTAKFQLRYKRFDNGEYTLRFESETEECNVRIRFMKGKTILLIDVGPSAKQTGEGEGAVPPPAAAQPGRH